MNASTTYAPPNATRSPWPTSDSTAASDASTPTIATHIDTDFARAGRKRSTTSTTRMLAARISTGSSAW